MKHLKLIINNSFKSKNISFFDKKELRKILNLYAEMVSDGDWKDYSLNISNKEISFNIYKRSSEHPIYKITKNLNYKNKNDKYFVKDANGNLIKKSSELENLINNVRWKKLKIVN